MNLEEFYDYKNLFMKDLCTNETIVKLITGNKNARVPNHDLPYTQVFPYEFVPETVAEGKVFVCYDVDIVSVPNKTFYIPVLYVWVFAHKSKFQTRDGSILLDKLAAAIDTHINGRRDYGLGELKLDSVRRFIPITDYLGRVMVYYARDFNRAPNRFKPPVNRKVNRGENK